MIDPAALPPSDDDQDLGDPALARRQHELAGLEELADMALVLCREFQGAAIETRRSAKSPQEMAAAQNYARAFDRTARTYRQCLALKDRLLNSEIARRAKAAALEPDQPRYHIEPNPIITGSEAALRRAPVREALTSIVQSCGRTPVEREALLADLNEFCDAPNDIMFRWGETSFVIQRYCLAKQLPFDLDRFAHTDWAKEEIKTQRAGSPYEGYQPKGEATSSLPLVGRDVGEADRVGKPRHANEPQNNIGGRHQTSPP